MVTLQDALILTGSASWLLVLGVLGGALGAVIFRGGQWIRRRLGERRRRPASSVPVIGVRAKCWACGRTESGRFAARDPEAALGMLRVELRARGWFTGRTRLACRTCAPATIVGDVNHG